MRVHYTCQQCGKACSAYPSKPRRFCSLRCAGLHQRSEAVSRFWSKVDRRGADDCWPWIGAWHVKGYGLAWMWERIHTAHRVAWMLTHGPIPAGVLCCHNCPTGDNPSCCNPAHLWLGSPADNTADMMAKGRGNFPLGERSGRAKVTDAQVREIRQRYAAGTPLVALSRAFGIGESTVGAIVHGRTWRHLL